MGKMAAKFPNAKKSRQARQRQAQIYDVFDETCSKTQRGYATQVDKFHGVVHMANDMWELTEELYELVKTHLHCIRKQQSLFYTNLQRAVYSIVYMTNEMWELTEELRAC